MDLFTSINPMETDSCQETDSRKQTKMAPSNQQIQTQSPLKCVLVTKRVTKKNRAILKRLGEEVLLTEK